MKLVNIRKNYLITVEQETDLSKFQKRVQKIIKKYLKEYRLFTFDFFTGEIIEAYTYDGEHLTTK